MDENVLSEQEVAERQRAEELDRQAAFELTTHRAEQATRILGEPLVVEAFANLEEVYMHALRFSDMSKPELREAARWRLEALQHFKNELRHVMDTGTIALKTRQQEDELSAWLAEEQAENG